MAIIKNNVIMRGASGKHADQVVLRQRFGQTVVCKLPCEYPPKTAAQLANQERFKRANDFARAAVKDPEKKAYYQSIKKPTQTAFNAAFQDAYSKPEVEVRVEDQTIIVAIKGKHPIQKIRLITQKEGSTIEKTKLLPTPKTADRWEFPLIEKPFTVMVYDIAGNICTIEIKT